VTGLRACRQCGRTKPVAEFIAGKAKRNASNCSTCRRKNAADHRRKYYASLPPDKRHELTHRRRAEDYGVEHVAYSRTAIMRRWRNACCYCNGVATHLDHVHPLAKGGADRESNMVPACARCNLSKGAKTLAEWSTTFGPEPPPF
jgi:5-methylcytosine-specific restriction endonuclease McrA